MGRKGGSPSEILNTSLTAAK